MATVNLHLSAFNAGELAPTIGERFGVEKVASGCRLLRNMIPHVHGPAMKRPGLEHVAMAASATEAPRLLDFNFSATSKILIEFAPGNFRFFKEGALVLSGEEPLVVPHPYTQAECYEVQAKQINDVVYLAHPKHHPLKLTRKSDTEWVQEVMPFEYPPLLDEYAPKEEEVAPTTTLLHEVYLEEAEEVLIDVRPRDEIPAFIATPSGVVDSEWFELNWTWPSALPDAAAGDATLTLQVVDSNGAWVDGSAVTLSTTSTAPAKTQWSFHPHPTTSTSMVIRRRVWSGSVWGAWATAATVVSVLESGTTAATMPKQEFRLVYGPKTQEGSFSHQVTVVPITAIEGGLMNGVRIQSYALPAGTATLPLLTFLDEECSHDYGVNFDGLPNPLPGGSVAKFQVNGGTSWTNLKTVVLRSGDVGVFVDYHRFRVSGSNVLCEKRNLISGTRYTWSTVATVAGSSLEDWKMRLWTNVDAPKAPYFGGISGRYWPSGDEEPIPVRFGRAASTGAHPDTGQPMGGVLIPEGTQWTFNSVIEKDFTVPAGAVVNLQRRQNGKWVNIKTWAIQDGGAVLDYTSGEDGFEEDTIVRVYYASTSGLRINALAWIKTVVASETQPTKLSVNALEGTGRTMTATEDAFQAGHVGSCWQIAHRMDTAYIDIKGVDGKFPTNKLVSKVLRVVGQWDVFSYGTWMGKLYLERKGPSGEWEILRVWASNKDYNITASGTTDTDTFLRLRCEMGMIGYAASGVPVPRFLLEAVDARTYGLVKVTGYTTPTEVTVDIIKPLGSTQPTAYWSEGAWSAVRGYPCAVATHEGRLWFGGTSHQPSTVWGSVSNSFEDFRRSTLDDGAIVATLAAETANYIRWLQPANDVLWVGTGGEEWALFSEAGGEPLTPVNLRARPRGAYSSAALPARRYQDTLLFVERNLRRLRRTNYDQSTGEFAAGDMTVLAPHATVSGIRQMAISQAPNGLVWAVTNDGRLISLTLEIEQNVYAWALHETDGTVASVAVLTGATSDEVYMSVVRGGTPRIERLDTQAMERNMAQWRRHIHLDAAKRYTFDSPATALTGLNHLNGRVVKVLADGVELTQRTVSGNAITLETGARDVIVGLPYTAKLQPMRMEVPSPKGTSQGRLFRVARVGVSVLDSRSGQVAESAAGVYEPLPYTHGAGLHTGLVETAIESSAGEAVDVCVEDSTAYPFGIRGLVVKIDIHGD